MRVLAISHFFPRVGDEAYGVFASRQLEIMREFGVELEVIVPVVRGFKILRLFKRWQHLGQSVRLCTDGQMNTHVIPYVRITGGWFHRWSGLSVYWAALQLIMRLHKQRNFDVIYSACLFPDGDAAVRFSRLLGIPATCWATGSDVNVYPNTNPRVHRRFVEVCKGLAGTMAAGQAVADKIDEVSGKKTLPVFGAVDLEQFCPVEDRTLPRAQLRLPPNKLIVLYVGTFKRMKGVHELIQAFSSIRKQVPDIILRFCGAGVEHDRMVEHIQREKLEDVIEISGGVEPKNMHQWMQAADCLVLPSHSEGMPNVVMEAMACGLPVVSTEVGGLPSAVGDCEGAILVKPKDVALLEEALVRVCSDQELRLKMGTAARAKAVETFGIRKNTRRVLDFLAEIVANASNHRSG